MNRSARNKTRFPRSNVHRFSLHGERDHAFHTVDRFVVMLVRMWLRHLRAHRDGELKHRHRTVRFGSFEQEFNFDLPDADDFVFHGRFTSLEWWPDELDSMFGGGGFQRLNGLGRRWSGRRWQFGAFRRAAHRAHEAFKIPAHSYRKTAASLC